MRVAGIRVTRPVMQSRVVAFCWNPAELQRRYPEFIMIHHLARVFLFRFAADRRVTTSSSGTNQPGNAPLTTPVKARPITPWTVAPRPVVPSARASTPARVTTLPLRPSKPVHQVRISTDPADARRTVITGRFAEVCAALDRLVLEQEAAA
jgi:hypothetical protein